MNDGPFKVILLDHKLLTSKQRFLEGFF